MAAKAPAVTVIIPCFNQGAYLGHAIESVRRQDLAGPVHCIVVDDGSSDNTSEVARSVDIELIRQSNRGVSEARNAGLRAARTEFVLFLDADDELLADAVARGVHAFRAQPDAAVVAGRAESMDSAGQPLPAVHADIDTSKLYEEWLSRNFVWTPGAALFRREALDATGGFPPGLGPAADYAVYLRFARAGRAVVIPDVLVRYRQHDSSMSRDPGLMLRATLEVLAREYRDGDARIRRHIRRARSIWCDLYGDEIVDRLRHDWRAGLRRPHQLRDVATLIRHCPRVVARHVIRKLGLTAARLLRPARLERNNHVP